MLLHKNVENYIHFVILIFIYTATYLSAVVNGEGARCSSLVRAFAHGVMGCRINPSWGGPTELFLIPASAPRLV